MKRSLLILLFTFVWHVHAQRSDFKYIDFSDADRIARSLKGEELSNLPRLAHNLTYGLKTDVERFRAIYYWVTHNIKNDYGLMTENENTRLKFKNDPGRLGTWHKSFKKKMFTKLLYKKRTLCSGYSYLIKELATLAGLECEIINGYGRTSASFKRRIPNHSWNAVKLNGKWYLCDATWSSGFIDDRYLFEFNYNNAYFLMSPKTFAKSHEPLDPEWLLLPTETLAASSKN